MSVTGFTTFVSSPANTATHIKIDGATGQWWFSNMWIEGCDKAIQVGSNSGTPAGPSQFGMVNSKLSAVTTVIDMQCARNPTIWGVQIAGDNGGVSTPAPVTVDATNTPEGVLFADSVVTGQAITPSTYPIGWVVHSRSGATAAMKVPNTLDLSYGASVRLARSDGTMIATLQQTGGPQLLLRAPTSTSTAAIKVLDTANGAILEMDAVTSSVNYLGIKPATSGNPAELLARGSGSDASLKLTPKGAGTVQVGGPLQLKTTTTGARPTAASAGAGGVMYDSTLSKPIYSDGTTWRDAAGTSV
jgi:hypothetical protein